MKIMEVAKHYQKTSGLQCLGKLLADYLVLVAGILENMQESGHRIQLLKSKYMLTSDDKQWIQCASDIWLCAISKRVMNGNYIPCIMCGDWVHRKSE